MKYFILIFSFLSAIICFSQNKTIDFLKLDKRNGIFYLEENIYTGACFQNYPSGVKGMEGSFKNGKREGVWTWYYENGTKKRETNYCDGKVQGESIIWYKNGQRRSKIIYDKGKNVKQSGSEKESLKK